MNHFESSSFSNDGVLKRSFETCSPKKYLEEFTDVAHSRATINYFLEKTNHTTFNEVLTDLIYKKDDEKNRLKSAGLIDIQIERLMSQTKLVDLVIEYGESNNLNWDDLMSPFRSGPVAVNAIETFASVTSGFNYQFQEVLPVPWLKGGEMVVKYGHSDMYLERISKSTNLIVGEKHTILDFFQNSEKTGSLAYVFLETGNFNFITQKDGKKKIKSKFEDAKPYKDLQDNTQRLTKRIDKSCHQESFFFPPYFYISQNDFFKFYPLIKELYGNYLNQKR